MKFKNNRKGLRARHEYDIVNFGPTLINRTNYLGGRKARRAFLRLGKVTARNQLLLVTPFVRAGKRATGISETKMFHISDLLSAVTQKLVSLGGLQSLYHFASFMNRTPSILNHELIVLLPMMKEAVLAQHPDLNNLVDPDEKLNEDNIESWVQKQIDYFGFEYLPITAGLEH